VFSTLASAAAAPVVMHGGFGFFFFLIPLFWILVFILVFGLIGRRFRRRAWNHGWGHGPGSWMQPSRNAEATLAERFANGDIDEKEYRARLEVLRANAFPPAPPMPPKR
jgi:putative membrane protein